jgi:aspartyl/asparaginyl beta-hydroxylase (cupin superfamily)
MAMMAVERLRQFRRQRLKKFGMRSIRRLGAVMGSQSLVGDKPVFDAVQFPFLKGFEDNWQAIRSELEEVLKDRASLPAFHEISPDQKKISRDDRWKTFIFWGFGTPSEANCKRCPETARLLATVPGLQTAWFSILAPGYHIRPHRGVTKGVVRVHLGLIVPEQRRRCTMRVDDQVLTWQEGKCLVFDDTYEHEVTNDTDEERVVLLFDFDRPMRPLGRAVHRMLVWGVKRSAYYKDAKRNMDAWEKSVQRADTMFDEPTDDRRDAA